MTTIITRTSKGSAITNNEFDANLNNLNTYKIEDSDTRSSVRPTLIADFANTKKLPLNATFSRGSTGTYYDGKTTVMAEQNLLAYSQDFDNADWRKQRTTVTANYAVAPDGTTTAELVVPTAVTGTHQLYYGSATSLESPVTFSFYAKDAGYTNVQLSDASNGSFQATFNLSAATSANIKNSTTSIYPVGNGWYKCVAVLSSFSSSSRPSINAYPAGATLDDFGVTFTGDGTSGIYIWGAQLEQRSTVTSYTPTTSSAITNYIPVLQTAAVNTPRFDVDPVTGESKGLLIESSATNLLTYSSQFDSWGYSPIATSVWANCMVAPDGTLSADKLVEASYNDYHRVFIGVNSLIMNQLYTVSFYIKAGEITLGTMDFWTGSARNGVSFDLTSVTATAYYAGTAQQPSISNLSSITNVGNGWYRITLALLSTSTFGNMYLYLQNAAAPYVGTTNYKGFYIWGAQLEAGSFATSYIPTTASQVTRASDSLYTTDVSWLNPNEGTFLFNKKAMGTKVNQTLFSLDNGTTDIESRVVLVPNSRNLLPYTEQFDYAVWIKSQATITSNVATSPNGVLTGSKLIESTANAAHLIRLTSIVPLGTSTFSIYAKSSERTQIAVVGSNNGANGGGTVYFNLSTGVIISNSNSSILFPSIVDVGGGWYRCIIVFSNTLVAAQNLSIYSSNSGTITYAGDGTSGIYIWGAQLELGPTATSYEPNPLYLSTFEVGSDGYALSDNNTWNNLAAYAYAPNDISASQNNNPYASVNIQSSTAGTKAIINKTSGTVDFKNCNIKDMSMGGGATFTASKTNNSYDQGNNFGITFQ